MAPAPVLNTEPHHFHLLPRAQDPNNPPLASIFALVINRSNAVASGTARLLRRSLAGRSTYQATAPLAKIEIIKRDQQILVIPTTYATLNSSPTPGAVIGITLGAILGFLLALTLLLFAFRAVGGGGEVVEEKIIRTRHRSHSRSKQSPSASSESEAPPVPVMQERRRESRQSRRETRRSTRQTRRPEPEIVTVEEEESVEGSAPAEVLVEEEEDDIVEVIEEHSPEPPPRRKASKRSGFRTVDPAEFGGGDAPSRRINRGGRA